MIPHHRVLGLPQSNVAIPDRHDVTKMVNMDDEDVERPNRQRKAGEQYSHADQREQAHLIAHRATREQRPRPAEGLLAEVGPGRTGPTRPCMVPYYHYRKTALAALGGPGNSDGVFHVPACREECRIDGVCGVRPINAFNDARSREASFEQDAK